MRCCCCWPRICVQSKLAEQTDIASEASARAEQLEEDLAGLRAQVAQVRGVGCWLPPVCCSEGRLHRQPCVLRVQRVACKHSTVLPLCETLQRTFVYVDSWNADNSEPEQNRFVNHVCVHVCVCDVMCVRRCVARVPSVAASTPP